MRQKIKELRPNITMSFQKEMTCIVDVSFPLLRSLRGLTVTCSWRNLMYSIASESTDAVSV